MLVVLVLLLFRRDDVLQTPNHQALKSGEKCQPPPTTVLPDGRALWQLVLQRAVTFRQA